MIMTENCAITISIVVIVKDGEYEISKTLRSIRAQEVTNLEVLVIDGASTDGTVSVIETFTDIVSSVISEPDKGHYDAYNKGKELATGDFILFLNCGDVFTNGFQLNYVISQISSKSRVYFCRAKIKSKKNSFNYPPLDFNMSNWHKSNLPNMQTMFFPKPFYKSHEFNLNLRLTADDDFKLHSFRRLDVKFIDTVLIDFKRDGISSNHKNFKLLIERIKESVIINLEHQRYFRLIIDPGKRAVMYLIHSLLGDESLVKFIKYIKR